MSERLTYEEAGLVLDLLKLWDACYENPTCKRGCECPRCVMTETTGSYGFDVFRAVQHKAENVRIGI